MSETDQTPDDAGEFLEEVLPEREYSDEELEAMHWHWLLSQESLAE